MISHAKKYTNGPRVSETWVWPSGATTRTSSSAPSVNDTLTGGTMVHGNFVDPNNWTYFSDNENMIHGTVTTSGHPLPVWSSTTTRTVHGCLNQNSNNVVAEPAIYPTWIANKALDALNEKVRGGLDLSIDAFQAKQMGRMFHGLTKLQHFVKGLGPRKWASHWLEFQYGWRPLVGEIYDSADELQRYALNKVKFHFSAKHVVKLPNTKQSITVDSLPLQVEAPVQWAGSTQGCKYGLILELPTSGFDLSRWTSLNPVSIAWELTPYSFVVDWVIDIGSFLRNTETALLYNSFFRSGYQTQWTRMNASYHALHSGAGLTVGSTQYDFWSCSVFYNRRLSRMTRAKLANYPFPYPPSINADFGWQRVLSAGALIQEGLGIRRKTWT